QRRGARPQPRDQPRGGGARAPDEAPPRQAPQAARSAELRDGHRGVSGSLRRRRSASTLRPMGILEKALNLGESKRFKEYEKRITRIAAFEPELELESDDELRERIAALRERAQNGESLDDLLQEAFAIVRDA